MKSYTSRTNGRRWPAPTNLIAKALFAFCCLLSINFAQAQKSETLIARDHQCEVDLRLPGMMKDIVSNALRLGQDVPEASVKAFLTDAEKKYATGDELLRAAARHFKIDEAELAAQVERMRHVNCRADQNGMKKSKGVEDQQEHESAVTLTPFAKDVALHVILHELGHALIREFDLPVLANEESAADAFATVYLIIHLPDRAVDVLEARTRSLMIEAREVDRRQWTVQGEHNSDARRAFQIAALAVAADHEKFSSVAKAADMSEDDIRKARDYGTEIHRSWRRTLVPLTMPDNLRSNEARVVCEDGTFAGDSAKELLAELDSIIRRFDWHSQVTIRFDSGNGGASWNRSKRTITVNSQYLQRFVKQGKTAESNENPIGNDAGQ